VSAKIGRHFWRHPGVRLDAEGWARLPDRFGFDPAQEAEWRDLLAGLHRAVDQELTARQRQVFVALVLNNVPLDTLVIELACNRNAIYKTPSATLTNLILRHVVIFIGCPFLRRATNLAGGQGSRCFDHLRWRPPAARVLPPPRRTHQGRWGRRHAGLTNAQEGLPPSRGVCAALGAPRLAGRNVREVIRGGRCQQVWSTANGRRWIPRHRDLGKEIPSGLQRGGQIRPLSLLVARLERAPGPCQRAPEAYSADPRSCRRRTRRRNSPRPYAVGHPGPAAARRHGRYHW